MAMEAGTNVHIYLERKQAGLYLKSVCLLDLEYYTTFMFYDRYFEHALLLFLF
jgi:hypothetical protein